MSLSRRSILAAAGAMAAPMTAAAAHDPDVRHTFVLVHGSWHGGWVWRDVRDRLEDRGHRVFTPTCTGCGERNHLITSQVNLTTHIDDIANVLRFEELSDVVLVGHSFAGLTITGAADRERERVRRMVFFDALVPHGDRMSCVPRDPETGAFPDWWRERVPTFLDGYQMVLWEHYPVEMLVPEDMTEHVERLRRLITTHPVGQWTETLVVEHGGWEGLNPAFIHCVGQTYRQTSDLMVGPARGEGWTYIPIQTPRNAMMTHPELVANLLEDLARV